MLAARPLAGVEFSCGNLDIPPPDLAQRPGGHRGAECVPGAFIGEMTVLTGNSATGTAVLSLPSRDWVIDEDVLRVLVARHDHIGRGFDDNLRDKRVHANAEISRTHA